MLLRSQIHPCSDSTVLNNSNSEFNFAFEPENADINGFSIDVEKTEYEDNMKGGVVTRA